jgi:two-component system chemotaxis family response regulator WspR
MNDLQIDDIKTDENAAMVLLVDDQAMIGEAVRRGLAHEDNIDFHFCADPHQAIAQAIRIKPTVILQDLVMPGLDGLTLVREYRNNPATRTSRSLCCRPRKTR